MIKENLSEKDLVSMVRAGNPQAFQIVMEKYYSIIKYVCGKFRLGEQDIEDIIQEASLKVWEKKSDLNIELSFGSYLITIVKHLVYKKVKARSRIILLEQYNNFQETIIEDSNDHLVFNDLKHHVNVIIGNMPEKQGKIVKLKVLDNFSTDEISSKLKITKRSTENHYYRGLEKIRNSLKRAMLFF